MKKILAIVLIFVLILSIFAGCAGSVAPTDGSQSADQSSTGSVSSGTAGPSGSTAGNGDLSGSDNSAGDTSGSDSSSGTDVTDPTVNSGSTDIGGSTDATDNSGNAGTSDPAGSTENSGSSDNSGGSSDNSGSSTDSSLADPDQSYGDDLEDSGIYDDYFDSDTVDIHVTYISGTKNAYKLTGNVLTFSGIAADSVYAISGQYSGSIVIDVGDDYKFELELTGLSLVSSDTNPITVLSGDKVTLTAKKGTENAIYDTRPAVDESDETLTKGAIHSEVDLQIGGKGSLSVVSENNNGIHTKDDLTVKNLTLTVTCQDNALKGNDGVEISGGTITLIAKTGDGIKTTNSDISSKGNQRGTVSIAGTNLTIYAACDGIDAAYDVVVDEATTVLNIYTDKYSNYSEEVTATASSNYYIRYSGNTYQYSVKYYNSDSDYLWVNATYHSAVSGGRSYYYYYSFPKKTEYSKMQVFVYNSSMQLSQDTSYVMATDYLTPNTSYDTFALSNRGGQLSYSWTNYSTSGGMGGMGGMDSGNTDKSDYSTKGIKAANQIVINAGTVTVKAYDDAIHANNGTTLENGSAALGNVTVNGGTVSLYSNDDGIHADGILTINGGTVNILNSYEGMEGSQVIVTGGNISVLAKDDGINSTATSGTGVTFRGGDIFIYCTGDGIDANSRTSYAGISFEGSNVVVISNSSGNSAIDTEQGYKYTAGSVIAIMPRGGMTGEATNCQNFSSVATATTRSFTANQTVTVSGDLNMTFTMPCSISNAYVVILNRSTSIS